VFSPLELLPKDAAGRLLSDEHFTVDGTLLEAWAGQKSFMRKNHARQRPDDPGNPTVNFHGECRSNDASVDQHVSSRAHPNWSATLRNQCDDRIPVK
jgi:hypothetical protein